MIPRIGYTSNQRGMTQRPGTVRHRTNLFEEAALIVEAEYGAELNLDVNYGNFRDPQSLIHFELLERHGYEISPAERKELPKAKKPTLKAAA